MRMLPRGTLRCMDLVQATGGHGAPAPNHRAVLLPQKFPDPSCPSPSADGPTRDHMGGQSPDPP